MMEAVHPCEQGILPLLYFRHTHFILLSKHGYLTSHCLKKCFCIILSFKDGFKASQQTAIPLKSRNEFQLHISPESLSKVQPSSLP